MTGDATPPGPAADPAVGSGLPAFTSLPDLACRSVGGSAVAASDELFADRENLLTPAPPSFTRYTYGHRGQVMDGWESRRRREPGFDWAIVRLGLPGVVRGVVVDTSFFTGNHPPEVSVEGTAVEGFPSPAELAGATWTPLVLRSAAAADSRNCYPVAAQQWVTHVRLCQYPDGGVARLRVHGEPVPDPRLLPAGGIDLAALANGAAVVGCSNMYYSSPTNLLRPGEARVMGEGWETARRRDGGNDWVEVRLACPGAVRLAEIDTTCFVGNAPGEAALHGYDGREGDGPREVELIPRMRLQPDTPHRVRVAPGPEVTHVRLDVYPDGGLARLRLHGTPSPQARAQLALRWFDLLSDGAVRQVLAAEGCDGETVDAVLAARPVTDPLILPAPLRRTLEL